MQWMVDLWTIIKTLEKNGYIEIVEKNLDEVKKDGVLVKENF